MRGKSGKTPVILDQDRGLQGPNVITKSQDVIWLDHFPSAGNRTGSGKGDIVVWSQNWALSVYTDSRRCHRANNAWILRKIQADGGVHIYDGGLISLNWRGLLGFGGYMHSTQSYFQGLSALVWVLQ